MNNLTQLEAARQRTQQGTLSLRVSEALRERLKTAQAALLKADRADTMWSWRYYGASAYERSIRVTDQASGSSMGIGSEEWQQIKEMFDETLALPELKPVLVELALAYGGNSLADKTRESN